MPSIIFSELLEISAEAGSDDRTNRLIKYQESPRSSAMPPGTFHISLRWANRTHPTTAELLKDAGMRNGLSDSLARILRL
jgi:hypothetical protein